jgi:PAS domain S-box-containing protein
MRRTAATTSHSHGDKYRNVFLHSAVSLWEEDISALRTMIREWRARGIHNLRPYLDSHPRVLRRAIHSIVVVDVNNATLKLYEAKEKNELLGPLDITLDVESIPQMLEFIMAIAEGKEDFEAESTALTRAGRKLDVIIKTCIPAEVDEYPYVLVSVIDISEHKRLERTLMEERALLRAVIDNIPDQVFLKDREGRFVVANRALAQWACAADPAELVGKSDRDYFPSDVALKFRRDDLAVLEDGKVRANVEEQIVSASGSKAWTLTTKVPIRDQSGNVTGLVGIARDVTGRKHFEEALRESEERYRTVFMEAPVGIFHSTSEGKLLSANPAFARMLGYDSPEQIMKAVNEKNAAEALFEDPQERAVVVDELTRNPGWRRREARYRHRDGGVVVAQLVVRSFIPPGAATPHFEGFVENITEQRRAEQAFSRERLFLTALMDTIPDSIYFKDKESRFILNNKAHARAMGVASPSEMLGKTDFDYFGREHAQEAFEDEQRIIQTGQPLVNDIEKETWPDRPHTWVSSTKMPLRDENGQIIGTFGMSRDMTERWEMEEKNLRLATLVDSVDDAVVGLDLERRITVWNTGAERTYGYSAEEMIGTSTSALIPADLEDEARLVREKVTRGERVTHYETTRLRKDGRKIAVSLTLSAIRDAGGKIVGFASTARDITAQKALQVQVIRAQRLESLATLAGGVAHQFNNINAAIKGYLDIVFRDTSIPDPTHSYINEALKAVDRAVEITERLQGLTSAASTGAESLRLEEAVPPLLSLFDEKLQADGISVHVDFRETPPVRVGHAMLSFIVTSLLTNSIQALLDCSSRLITLRTRSSAGFSSLEVNDTGCGILPENLSRIFTPFFTTKGEWADPKSPQSRVKGVGLSLAVCQSSVGESGGWIEVESVPHEGSTFRVWLPVAASTNE